MLDLQETKAKVRREKAEMLRLPQVVPGMRVLGADRDVCDE
jgi:hypothetical protein